MLDDETYTPQALADEIGILPMLGDRRGWSRRGVDFSRCRCGGGLCLALEGLPNSPHSVVLVVALGELLTAATSAGPQRRLRQYRLWRPPLCGLRARRPPGSPDGWLRHFAAEGAVVSAQVCDELVALPGAT